MAWSGAEISNGGQPPGRGTGSTGPGVQDEVRFASFLPQHILAFTHARCYARGCSGRRDPVQKDEHGTAENSKTNNEKARLLTLASTCVFFLEQVQFDKNIWCQHPKHPSLGEPVNKRWSSPVVECYIAIKKSQLLLHVTKLNEFHNHRDEPW